MNIEKIKTLGDLKKSGYQSRHIKDELRNNLITKLKTKEPLFKGILGFQDTVIPELERAILSRHNILFLGLRGQAKTRIARSTTELLDEYIPAIDGSDLNDNPLHPISRTGKDIVEKMGDKTPIKWVHRSERYVEKLATPDVSVADLIGDVDPIKAATLKLPYSDERVIHFGLVPRAHRGIFVINELPDLQPRIQVSLFNILQEGDIQIRGFKLRLPLDIMFVFTANPEDYTNRGSIITPLKDRIESQIITHYPHHIEESKEITRQEARILNEQSSAVSISEEVRDLLEMIVYEARESDYIDEKSGVSARLSITALENLVSTAERRLIINNEKSTHIRITDFWGIIPAVTGKVELVYEGEQEGPFNVAMNIIQDGIEDLFTDYYLDPLEVDDEERDPYEVIKMWFAAGNSLVLGNDDSDKEYQEKLDSVAGLEKCAAHNPKFKEYKYFWMELILQALAAKEIIEVLIENNKVHFNDFLSDSLLDFNDEFDAI